MPANTYHRELQIDIRHLRASDDDARTAPCVVSTEHPVDRGGYREILDHSPGAVDLSRAPLPLIEQHDGSKLNVGLVESLHVTGRKLRGVIRLGSSARAKELWSDIKSGVIRNLSIGYQWLEFVERGDDVIVTKFAPYEVSLVSIPADPNAGINRSNPIVTDQSNTNTEAETDIRDETVVERMSRGDRRRASAAATEERNRINAINRHFSVFGYGTGPGSDAQRFIDEGIDAELAGRFIMELQRAKIQPVPTHGYAPGADPREQIQIVSRHQTASLRHFPGETTRDREANAFAAGQWVRGALFGDSKARSWMGQRAMSHHATAGGVLVPEQLSSAIISLAEEYGIARAHARIWPMSSDVLSIPRRASGVTGYYVGENAEITASEMSLDNINLVARKYAAMIRFSSELAEDAIIDIASLLAEECGRTFAEAEDSALFNGDGTSTYGGITGILDQIVSTAGAIDATSGVDTFAEITAVDLANCSAALPSYARRGAAWFVSPEANDIVFQRLAAASGGATMIERGGVIIASYGGYPIIVSNSMPTSGANDTVMILFGDMSQGVAMGLRRDVRIRVDESRFAEYDQLALICTQRFDIVAHDVGSATAAGPLCALVGNT